MARAIVQFFVWAYFEMQKASFSKRKWFFFQKHPKFLMFRQKMELLLSSWPPNITIFQTLTTFFPYELQEWTKKKNSWNLKIEWKTLKYLRFNLSTFQKVLFYEKCRHLRRLYVKFLIFGQTVRPNRKIKICWVLEFFMTSLKTWKFSRKPLFFLQKKFNCLQDSKKVNKKNQQLMGQFYRHCVKKVPQVERNRQIWL